jgi:hypothetical protein
VTERLDVAERMAEGRQAVERTQSYVRACHALGYQHQDLTAHPSQIHDWYDSEDGLDLRLLDRDCAELRAAGLAMTEALRLQRAQVAELATAWMGPGADAAMRLLQRHCDVANTVVTELRAAAQRCESLRDNLWYLVDSKVATAIAIDDRTQAQRPAWLAAGAAVTTGTGDQHTAAEVVRQQVMPYVDNDIRNDWLTVMRSTSDGVQTSYGMVTDRMAAAPAVRFEFPGDLGPNCQSVQPVSSRPPPVLDLPADLGPVEPAPVTAVPTMATAAPAPVTAPPATFPDWGTALGGASGMPAGDLGGGLGGAGGGLIGLADRIVDAMGGLLGSAADGLGSDPLGDGEGADLEDGLRDGLRDDAFDEEEPDAAKDVDDTEETQPGGEAQPDGPAPTDKPPADTPALPADTPAPVAAPPVEEVPPTNEGSTPCEIAADQLPQAGQ